MYPTRYYTREERNKLPKKNKFLRILISLIMLVVFFYVVTGGFLFISDKSVGFISPIVAEVVDRGIAIFRPDKNSEGLEKAVQNALGTNKDGDFGIVVKNLKTGERYYFNEHKVFETASLYKLWVMATTFLKIEDGTLSESAVLTGDVANLNETFNIASESAELTEGIVSWPVKNALQQMITISDNYSALLLTKKIGLSSVTSFLSKNGLTESKVGTGSSNPLSTPFDIALFYEKLYKVQLASSTYTEEMFKLLKAQRVSGKLPKYLPEKAESAHKTGELGSFSHDAGIVYSSKGDYIFVVMSKTNSQVKANEKIAQVSKAVYDYFNN